MEQEEVIKEYLKCLEKSDFKGIIALFSEDAVINSPLYGKIKTEDFYKDLFKDTSKSVISLMNILKSINNKNILAGHFKYDWIIKAGDKTSFECVDIFNFNKDGKIKELTIIYDTSNIRGNFINMKNNRK